MDRSTGQLWIAALIIGGGIVYGVLGPADGPLTYDSAAQRGGAQVGAILLPTVLGLPSILWWAFKKFRWVAAKGPLILWTVLVVLFALPQLLT